MSKLKLEDQAKQRTGVRISASFIVAIVTFLLLPESARLLTRLSLTLHAYVCAILAFELALPTRSDPERWWWRMRVPLLAGLVSIFLGRASDLLYRWDRDWPGMWKFVGLMILLWAALRPRNPNESVASVGSPQL